MGQDHTPAPWLLDRGDVTDTSGNIIAWVSSADDFTTNCDDPHPETTANARLIAAAPELLHALKAALAFISANVADPDITDEMAGAWIALLDAQPNAAIRKAEGK